MRVLILFCNFLEALMRLAIISFFSWIKLILLFFSFNNNLRFIYFCSYFREKKANLRYISLKKFDV